MGTRDDSLSKGGELGTNYWPFLSLTTTFKRDAETRIGQLDGLFVLVGQSRQRVDSNPIAQSYETHVLLVHRVRPPFGQAPVDDAITNLKVY